MYEGLVGLLNPLESRLIRVAFMNIWRCYPCWLAKEVQGRRPGALVNEVGHDEVGVLLRTGFGSGWPALTPGESLHAVGHVPFVSATGLIRWETQVDYGVAANVVALEMYQRGVGAISRDSVNGHRCVVSYVSGSTRATASWRPWCRVVWTMPRCPKAPGRAPRRPLRPQVRVLGSSGLRG